MSMLMNDRELHGRLWSSLVDERKEYGGKYENSKTYRYYPGW